jgi:hypothetical protein
MNFLNIIKKAAPFLGTAVSLAVPGPLGAMASSLLTKALGLPADAAHEDIATAIVGMTPEQAVALKTAEETFAMQMKQIDIASIEALAKMSFDDRAGARTMYENVKGYTEPVLAYTAVGGFLTVVILMMTLQNIPASAHDALMILLGALSATFKDVYGFFFGSSAGSEAKNQLLADKK